MRRRLRLTMLLVPTLAVGAAAARAQAPSPSAPPAPQTAAAVPAVAATGGQEYTYNPQGRRDPFVSLIARGADAKSSPGGRHADGLAGLSVAELSVRGVMKNRDGYVAIVQGPDNKTYIAHPADKLLDGTIRAIGGDGLVIVQEVNDPLSLVKQKEVRKGLRASDEGK